MESISGGVGIGVGVVGRVRQFLADTTVVSEAGAEFSERPDPFVMARVAHAKREGRVARDLEELERRLARLQRAFPELGDIEINPLLRSAGQYLDARGDDETASVGGGRLGVGRSVRSWTRGVEGR